MTVSNEQMAEKPNVDKIRLDIESTYVLGVSDIPVREGDITPELRRIMRENSEQIDKLLPR
jgi:hypothetical protein